jgi:carboxymethylenebutenolidase
LKASETGEDKTRFQGYLAVAAASGLGGPGVLVLPAWWGLNDFFKNFCDRLSDEGFVVFAPDLYNGKVAETVDQAQQYMSEMSDEETVRHLIGSVELLRKSSIVTSKSIGVVGFSMGAFLALQLSTLLPEDVRAVVAFYGTSAADFKAARAVYQCHFAEHDEFEPDEEVRALEERLSAAGKTAEFYHYPGTRHWFFEKNQPQAYHPESADLAWRRTITFLRETLKS